MQAIASNQFKLELAQGLINFGSIGTGQGSPDTFKIILMNDTYSFDRVNHKYYSDVSSSELSSGHGYTQNSKTLSSSTLSYDANNALNVVFPPVKWTASGGNIGPSAGAIIFDDTLASKTIVGYLDFEIDQTVVSETEFYLFTITVQL